MTDSTTASLSLSRKRKAQMPPDHVLRVRRTDKEGEHLLVNVSRTGVKALDLKLVASEGEFVYPGKIRESAVKSLQVSNYSGNLDDWKAVLIYALLQERVEGTPSQAFDGLETVAAVSGATLTITIRKNISGITQRLGAIVIEQNNDEEIDIFGWTCTAVASGNVLRDQLETLQTSISSQQKQVAKLNQQLDNLVKAKKEHEEELLRKFGALLNTKKLKIRDQQRLLAGANIDADAAGIISDARSGNTSRKAGGSARKGKRKANGIIADEDTATDEDEDDSNDRAETPQPSDGAVTEDDSDQDGFEAAAPPSQASRRSIRSNGKAPAATTAIADGGDAMESEHSFKPPPPRALPFKAPTKSETIKPKKTPEPVRTAVDEDDDDTDEEL